MNRVENEIFQIAKLVIAGEPDFENNLSLSGGLAGISLFLYHAGTYFSDEKFLGKSAEYFQKCLYDPNQLNVNGFSLFGGTTGTYWLYQYYINLGFCDLDDIGLLDEYDSTLQYLNRSWDNERNYDLLYGLIGAGVYFLERNTKHKQPFVANIIDRILSYREPALGGNTWYDYDRASPQNRIQNLGFAHGISSIMMFCELAYEHNPTSCKNTILHIYNVYKNLPSHTSNECYFPNTSSDAGMEGLPSRVAWCYGDLMVGYSMLKSGKKIGNIEMASYGEEIILNTVERHYGRDFTGISDNSLCHGCAGILYIIEMSKNLSAIIKEKTRGNEWLSSYFQVKEITSNRCYSKNFHTQEMRYIKWYGLLQGLAGIGLCLLGTVEPKSANWSKIILV